jgi:hypothetical protein
MWVVAAGYLAGAKYNANHKSQMQNSVDSSDSGPLGHEARYIGHRSCIRHWGSIALRLPQSFLRMLIVVLHDQSCLECATWHGRE